MFLVVDVTQGQARLEVEALTRYTHVSLVDIFPKPNKKLMVLGDFVELSIIGSQSMGLVGVSGAPFQTYIPINNRRNTVTLSIVSAKDLSHESTINNRLVLHFKTDK